MIDKRIDFYKRENARLFALIDSANPQNANDLMIKTINEHEAVIRELKHIKNLNIPIVGDCTPPDKFGTPTIKYVLANPCDFCKYDKYEGENKNKDACSHCAKSLKDNEYYR